MSRSPSRWRAMWALLVRGFKTLLPLPESEQEAWAYRSAAPAPKKRTAAKTGKATKGKTTAKSSTTTTTRKTPSSPKARSGTKRKSTNAKKSVASRGTRAR